MEPSMKHGKKISFLSFVGRRRIRRSGRLWIRLFSGPSPSFLDHSCPLLVQVRAQDPIMSVESSRLLSSEDQSTARFGMGRREALVIDCFTSFPSLFGLVCISARFFMYAIDFKEKISKFPFFFSFGRDINMISCSEIRSRWCIQPKLHESVAAELSSSRWPHYCLYHTRRILRTHLSLSALRIKDLGRHFVEQMLLVHIF